MTDTKDPVIEIMKKQGNYELYLESNRKADIAWKKFEDFYDKRRKRSALYKKLTKNKVERLFDRYIDEYSVAQDCFMLTFGMKIWKD